MFREIPVRYKLLSVLFDFKCVAKIAVKFC
jgi:hypothetical protein